MPNKLAVDDVVNSVVSQMLDFMLTNNPEPSYVHQTNLIGILPGCTDSTWAADPAHTPLDAIFLVPPQETDFRLYGQRAIIVNFKHIPQLSNEIRQWRDRYGDAAVNAELDARRDAELDERRELLAWEEERATNDAYEKLARGWIG